MFLVLGTLTLRWGRRAVDLWSQVWFLPMCWSVLEPDSEPHFLVVAGFCRCSAAVWVSVENLFLCLASCFLSGGFVQVSQIFGLRYWIILQTRVSLWRQTSRAGRWSFLSLSAAAAALLMRGCLFAHRAGMSNAHHLLEGVKKFAKANMKPDSRLFEGSAELLHPWWIR